MPGRRANWKRNGKQISAEERRNAWNICCAVSHLARTCIYLSKNVDRAVFAVLDAMGKKCASTLVRKLIASTLAAHTSVYSQIKINTASGRSFGGLSLLDASFPMVKYGFAMNFCPDDTLTGIALLQTGNLLYAPLVENSVFVWGDTERVDENRSGVDEKQKVTAQKINSNALKYKALIYLLSPSRIVEATR